jgi:AmiR/NasT family two-component response regulator
MSDDRNLDTDRHSDLTPPAREQTVEILTEKVRNLEFALTSNRRIGMAIGVLMTSELITEESALELMREASHELKLKLRDVAERVLLTGTLPTSDDPPPR